MTTSLRGLQCRHGRKRPHFWRSGFSLIEVVVATGLCTYALVIIACLLPMGLGTVQIADSQIVESEIFNRIWLEVNTVPYYDLPSFQRFQGGSYSDGTTNSNGVSYFDKDGGEIGGSTATTTPPVGAVYKVYCTLIYPNSPNQPSNINTVSSINSRLTTLGPPVDGLGTSAQVTNSGGSMGAGMAIVRIDIGFHLDPSTLTAATDTRVASRSYAIAKRDTASGN